MTTKPNSEVADVLGRAAGSVRYLSGIFRSDGLTLTANLYAAEAEEIEQTRTTVAALIAERDALRALCQTTHDFLTHGYWGTIDYMEGTEIYGDLKKHAALLALATTPTQDKAND